MIFSLWFMQMDAVPLKKITYSFSNCLIGLFDDSGHMFVVCLLFLCLFSHRTTLKYNDKNAKCVWRCLGWLHKIKMLKRELLKSNVLLWRTQTGNLCCCYCVRTARAMEMRPRTRVWTGIKVWKFQSNSYYDSLNIVWEVARRIEGHVPYHYRLSCKSTQRNFSFIFIEVTKLVLAC